MQTNNWASAAKYVNEIRNYYILLRRTRFFVQLYVDKLLRFVTVKV